MLKNSGIYEFLNMIVTFIDTQLRPCLKGNVRVDDKADLTKVSKSDLPEHTHEISKSSKEMIIIHMNCRSLTNKEEELQFIVDDVNPDIICLTETWLDESIPQQALIPDGYSVIRKDRSESFKQKQRRRSSHNI